MKLCLISDTHDQHDKVVLPEADILIHAGDLTLAGEPAACRSALQWLNAQPHKHVVVIAGNHDFAFESPHKGLLLEGLRIVYLENSGVELEGLKIWGSPVQPWFHDWAFNVQRGAAIRQYWDEIPAGLDVLITHGPPYGVLDQARPDRSDHLGCEELDIAVKCRPPILHVFGHIHGSFGEHIGVDTVFVNASQVNEAYQIVNTPITHDMD